jgi:hypothetical protein
MLTDNHISKLLIKVSKGDAQAFKQLYEEHYDGLFVFAQSLVDFEDARDAYPKFL